MGALTKDRNTRTKAHTASRTGRRGVAANAVIFKGALLALNAAGWLVAVTDAAAIRVVGIAEENVNATGAANGAKLCSYITGLEVELVNLAGAIVQANLGRGCYAGDDQSVTTKGVSVNKVFVGVVTEFTAALVWVMVDDSVIGVIGDEQIAPVTYAAAAPAAAVPMVEMFEIPDAAGADYDVVVPEKLEVIDTLVQKTALAAGANANTVQVKNAAAAITDAISINGAADGDLKRAGNITDANSIIAAAGTMRITIVRAGGNAAVKVAVTYIKRAA